MRTDLRKCFDFLGTKRGGVTAAIFRRQRADRKLNTFAAHTEVFSDADDSHLLALGIGRHRRDGANLAAGPVVDRLPREIGGLRCGTALARRGLAGWRCLLILRGGHRRRRRVLREDRTGKKGGQCDRGNRQGELLHGDLLGTNCGLLPTSSAVLRRSNPSDPSLARV